MVQIFTKFYLWGETLWNMVMFISTITLLLWPSVIVKITIKVACFTTSATAIVSNIHKSKFCNYFLPLVLVACAAGSPFSDFSNTVSNNNCWRFWDKNDCASVMACFQDQHARAGQNLSFAAASKQLSLANWPKLAIVPVVVESARKLAMIFTTNSSTTAR